MVFSDFDDLYCKYLKYGATSAGPKNCADPILGHSAPTVYSDYLAFFLTNSRRFFCRFSHMSSIVIGGACYHSLDRGYSFWLNWAGCLPYWLVTSVYVAILDGLCLRGKNRLGCSVGRDNVISILYMSQFLLHWSVCFFIGRFLLMCSPFFIFSLLTTSLTTSLSTNLLLD